MFAELLSLFVLLAVGIDSSIGFKVNITSFGNCDFMKNVQDSKHFVIVRDVEYEYVDGYCDTVHGKYNIPSVNTADKKIEISMYRCRTKSVGQCNDNRETFTEHLRCDRFKEDASGPWYMISDGLSGSHCGQEAGDFELRNATLRSSYISSYMVEDVDHARHRMELLILKEGKPGEEDIVRACINTEFDIIY